MPILPLWNAPSTVFHLARQALFALMLATIPTAMACRYGEPTDTNSVQAIWISLGEAYANSSINVSVFRCESMISLPLGGRVVSYFDGAGSPILAYIPEDNGLTCYFSLSPKLESSLLNDGHCSINIGLGSDGLIQVIYGAHATQPWLASVPLSSIISGAQEPIHAIRAPLAITYPQFIGHNGDLYLWYRRDPESAIYRLTYDPVAHRFPWPGQEVLLPAGTDANAPYPYLDKPSYQASQWQLTWMYRLPIVLTQGRVVNEGLYAAASRDGGQTWIPPGGPPTRTIAPRNSAYRLLDLPLEIGLLNQGNTFSEPAGATFTTIFMKDNNSLYQIHLLEHGNGQPSIEVVSKNTQVFELEGRGTLVLPLSRAEVVASPNYIHVVYRLKDQIIISTRTRSGFKNWQHRTIMAPQGLGTWEPVLHREAWLREGKLRLYVQHSRQGPKDTAEAGGPAQAYLLEVPRRSLER